MRNAPLRASVVVATYNRPRALQNLLRDLSYQTMAPSYFEVIIVDDGSNPSVDRLIEPRQYPYQLRLLAQQNQGPATARNRGVSASRAPIVVFLDDDMRVGPEFLSEHLREHERGDLVVIGRIESPEHSDELPVFERFHLRNLEAQQRGLLHTQMVLGSHLCTGNASMRRDRFVAMGGFDVMIPRSEDRDLGLRLEKQGVALHFLHTAKSTHCSDHTTPSVWLKRAYDYGQADTQIARKHPNMSHASPWRFLFLIRPAARPLALLSAVFPDFISALPILLLHCAQVVDQTSSRASLKLTELTYALQYFRGVGDAIGSSEDIFSDMLRYASLLADQSTATPFQSFVGTVLQDHHSLIRNRAKYHQEQISPLALPLQLCTKTGLQILVLVRLMQYFKLRNHAEIASFISRAIRHAYQADIHPESTIAPGISIVHGNGIVISRHATVESGCILFQNVTLGEGLEPGTRRRGGPHLQTNVHVGPGSSILGPVVIGAGSKIQAGCVVTGSLSPGSRAFAPAPQIVGPFSAHQDTSIEPANPPGEVAS